MLELTNADLLASTASGGALARQMEDQLQRQHQALTRLHDRRWLTLLGSNRPVGSFDGEVGAEGEVSPDSGFDMPGNPESRRAGVHLLGDYRYSEALTLGGSLAFQRSRDKLDHGGRIEGDTWQLGLFGLYNDGGPEWLAGELNLGHTRYDSKRSVYLQAAGGPVLLDQRLSGDTSAWSWGARLEGGYDFSFGELRSGPLAGLDYMHYRIDDFREDEALRTALGYEKQDYDSLEASLGWRLRGELALGANAPATLRQPALGPRAGGRTPGRHGPDQPRRRACPGRRHGRRGQGFRPRPAWRATGDHRAARGLRRSQQPLRPQRRQPGGLFARGELAVLSGPGDAPAVPVGRVRAAPARPC